MEDVNSERILERDVQGRVAEVDRRATRRELEERVRQRMSWNVEECRMLWMGGIN